MIKLATEKDLKISLSSSINRANNNTSLHQHFQNLGTAILKIMQTVFMIIVGL